MNRFGNHLTMSIFGESHGHGIGAVVDNLPSGLEVRASDIQVHLDRRRPGRFATATPRQEADRVEILAGTFKGHSTGAPIHLLIRNQDADSSKYEVLRPTPRPGHADYTLQRKFGGFHDYRGGGHSSGRLTAAMVAAGALAHRALADREISVEAQTVQVADVVAPEDAGFSGRWDNPVHCGHAETATQMEEAILAAKADDDSVGGTVGCRITGLPTGIGEPIFDAVESVLAHGMLAIPAVRGVEFGTGFAATRLRGSEHNDAFYLEDDVVHTRTNHAGGVSGGITNGMPVTFRVAFKPTSSIAKAQETVDLVARTGAEIRIAGRHDPCIVPRAVPVVECLAAFTIMDLMLRQGAWPVLARPEEGG